MGQLTNNEERGLGMLGSMDVCALEVEVGEKIKKIIVRVGSSFYVCKSLLQKKGLAGIFFP